MSGCSGESPTTEEVADAAEKLDESRGLLEIFTGTEADIIYRVCDASERCGTLPDPLARLLLQSAFAVWERESLHHEQVSLPRPALLHAVPPLVVDQSLMFAVFDAFPPRSAGALRAKAPTPAAIDAPWHRFSADLVENYPDSAFSLTYDPFHDLALSRDLTRTGQRCRAPPFAAPLPVAFSGNALSVSMKLVRQFPAVQRAIVPSFWCEPISSVYEGSRTDIEYLDLPLMTLRWLEPALLLNKVSDDLEYIVKTELITPAALSPGEWLFILKRLACATHTAVIPATGQIAERASHSFGLGFFKGDVVSFARCVRNHTTDLDRMLEQMRDAQRSREADARRSKRGGIGWMPWTWLGYERLVECAAVSFLARLAPCLGLEWRASLPDVERVLDDVSSIKSFIDGDDDCYALDSLESMELVDENKAEAMQAFLESDDEKNVDPEHLTSIRPGLRDRWFNLSILSCQASISDSLHYMWPHTTMGITTPLLAQLERPFAGDSIADSTWTDPVDHGKQLDARASTSLEEAYCCYLKAPTLSWLKYYDAGGKNLGEVEDNPGYVVRRLRSCRAVGTVQGMVSFIRAVFSLELGCLSPGGIEHRVYIHDGYAPRQLVAVLYDGIALTDLTKQLSSGLKKANTQTGLRAIARMVPVRESRRPVAERLVDWFVFAYLIAGPVQPGGAHVSWVHMRAFAIKTGRMSVFHPADCKCATEKSVNTAMRFSLSVEMDEALNLPPEIPRLRHGNSLSLPLTPWNSLCVACVSFCGAFGPETMRVNCRSLKVITAPIELLYNWGVSGLGNKLAFGAKSEEPAYEPI